MYLVIDCNQASRLPIDRQTTRRHALIVSPDVLAEILLRSNPEPTLSRIRQYHFKIGLMATDIVRELCHLGLSEITKFEPFPSPGKDYIEDYDFLTEAIYRPSTGHLAWASDRKANHRNHCGVLIDQSRPAREAMRRVAKEERAKGSPQWKLSSFEEIIPCAPTPDSFSGDVLRRSLSIYGAGPSRAAEIYAAVLSNNHLRALFNILTGYCLSRAGAWADQKYNFNPSPNQDDITDILLPFYAADGGCLVTEDTMLKRLIKITGMDKAIEICGASEICQLRA